MKNIEQIAARQLAPNGLTAAHAKKEWGRCLDMAISKMKWNRLDIEIFILCTLSPLRFTAVTRIACFLSSLQFERSVLAQYYPTVVVKWIEDKNQTRNEKSLSFKETMSQIRVIAFKCYAMQFEFEWLFSLQIHLQSVNMVRNWVIKQKNMRNKIILDRVSQSLCLPISVDANSLIRSIWNRLGWPWLRTTQTVRIV